MSDDLPRALEVLWREPVAPRRSRSLTRERIVRAAIDLADADGLGALSMARLAERLGCGTMSLYRHVANKDELLTFMLSTAPGPPPSPDPSNWAAALQDWANGLWSVYHRHPWVLQAGAAGPPADPGQLAWLDAGLATLAKTGLAAADKLIAVTAVLHYVRGAAALNIDAGRIDWPDYPVLLRRLVDAERFPALAAALADGAFDRPDDDPQVAFRAGLRQLVDGIRSKLQ
jgi:AcrR family transcriptional regulator